MEIFILTENSAYNIKNGLLRPSLRSGLAMTNKKKEVLMDKTKSDETEKLTNSTIDSILPTSNEEEMKNLMKDLDREQAYREHKCWRQYVTVIISVIFVSQILSLFASVPLGHCL